MASIAQLNAVADRNRPETDSRNQGLMQNAVVKKNTGVELHGQASNEHRYATGGNRKKSPQKVQQSNQATSVDDVGNSLALQQQTDVLRDQSVATQKQTGILDRQSGLMNEQIQATQAVSASVERLYEYMKAEKSKPVAKIQQPGQGHTYEGQFSRVNDNGGNGFDPFGALDEINDLRRGRSERARNQPRDKRGRFKSKGKKPGGFRLPKAGKLLKVGGGIGGALMVADGLMDISDHEGDAFFEGGLSSRGGGYAQAIGGGAMTGAAIGSVVPVIGTAVGAAVGAALGGLGALIVDNKKEIANGYNKIMGQPQDTRAMGRSEAQSKDIADAAMTQGLGSVSQSFESGNKGVSTISGGVGDAGGQSYGAHQLSSKTGTMTAFLRSEQGSKYYNEFRGMQPGSKEFNDKYKEVVDKDGAGMEAAQKDYITKSHYSPVAEWFQKQYGMDLGEHSRALKEALYSVGVQYGPGGAKSLIKEAFDGMDVANSDDGKLIQALQDYRASSVGAKFKSSSGTVRQSIAGRARDENTALQKMLVNERTGQSGSGIGSVYSQQMVGAFGGKEQKGTGGSGNGTVGIMPMQAGGGGGGAGGDEAGGGTAAAELSPADGALYNLGMKHTRPNDNSVNMSGLNPKFKKAWYTMVGDWVQNNNGGTVNVASAFRTRMEQEQLWVKYGRNTKRVARPGTSRHESGFAIDIDRNSAQSLERTGMFKKYGFHRPLSNEPWHVEMIGAGKGGAGGGPAAGAGGESPQVMQQAASKEMEKAAEAVVSTAEENTREKVKDSGAGGATPTDTEAKPDAATEQGANAAAGEVKTDTAKTPAEAMGAATPDDGKKADGTQRTPAEQALYEQYLKNAGGDPRAVPDAVASPTESKMRPWAERQKDLYDLRNNPYGGPSTTPAATGPVPMSANFNGARTPSSFGSSSGFMGTPQIYGGSSSVGGRVEVLPGVTVNGGMNGPSVPYIPSVESVVSGYENQAINKALGKIPNMAGSKVMNGIGMSGGVSFSNPFGSGGPLTSIMKGNMPSLRSSSISPESPGSPSYYRNETPVATRASAAPAQAIPLNVATEAKPDKIEQQKFDTVQQVAIADAGAMAGGGGGGAPATGGGGAPKASDQNNTAQLEEIPAIMEDLGILFINMGYV